MHNPCNETYQKMFRRVEISFSYTKTEEYNNDDMIVIDHDDENEDK